MGWSNNAMTTRYQHLIPDLRYDIARQVDQLLWTPNWADETTSRNDLRSEVFTLVKPGGQGRGRTADLPIFRTPVQCPCPVGTVRDQRRNVVAATGGRLRTKANETEMETAA